MELMLQAQVCWGQCFIFATSFLTASRHIFLVIERSGLIKNRLSLSCTGSWKHADIQLYTSLLSMQDFLPDASLFKMQS